MPGLDNDHEQHHSEQTEQDAAEYGPVAQSRNRSGPCPVRSSYCESCAARAARTALWIATDPALAEKTGGYYRSLKHREKPLDFDAETSARLWAETLALNGIEEPTLG